jgi:uncharacterized protein DUF4236
MPFRFRKSFNIFPGVKANVSKGGVSFTVGTKGYHLNFSKRGVRQTVGLPGSGISETSYLVKNDPKEETESEKEKNGTIKEAKHTSNEKNIESREEAVHIQARRRTSGWMLLIGVVVIYLGALVLGLIPANFLSQLLHTLTDWARGLGL